MSLIIRNDKITHPVLEQFEIELYLKREDLLHPHISGNKFRKLKYNISEAKLTNTHTLLTFGGAYSNHIAATAAAGKKYNFNTIGVIRGEELGLDIKKTLSQNNTLNFAHNQGMRLHFISRAQYQLKEQATFVKYLKKLFGNFYLIPEGGTNKLAIKGCSEILTANDNLFDIICCSVGTGGTISGIINSLNPKQSAIGFSALKENYLHTKITNNTNSTQWKINRNYHFGGYAKTTPKLIQFINEFKSHTKIQLDPIYTGKLLYGVFEEIKKEHFNKKTRILAIHTGGLQGIKGINTKLNKKGLTPIITDYEF